MAIVIPSDNRIFVCEYAQLHTLPHEGGQRTLVGEGPLVLGYLTKPEKGDLPILQVGVPENLLTWQLTPDLPTLKVAQLTFMFAVPFAEDYNVIQFVEETPDPVLGAFEHALQQHTAYAVVQDVPQMGAIPAGEKVESPGGTMYTTTPGTATNIMSAGAAIASGIATVGDHIGRGLVHVGAWYRSKAKPCTEEVQLSERTKQRIENAKKTTGAAAKVATGVAGAVGHAVGAVAHKATHPFGKPKAEVSVGIGRASVIALVDVLDAMHDAGRTVVATSASETATCVQYKYGDHAGEAAVHGLGMTVDAYDVYGAYRAMRTRALARAFASGAVFGPSRKDRRSSSMHSAPPGAVVGSAPGGEAMNQAAPLPLQQQGTLHLQGSDH